MNEGKRLRLIGRMGPLHKYNGGVAAITMPLVTPEEYFDGAEGEAPLLCNSAVDLDSEAILKTLTSLRARPEVDDVRIAIVNCDDGEWPFSDKVVVVTTADDDTLLEWLPEGFEPDEVWEGIAEHIPSEQLPLRAGQRMVWLWYD